MNLSKKPVDYAGRIALLKQEALFQSLDPGQQQFLLKAGYRYRLSFQELRQLAEIAVDFDMWEEPSLAAYWGPLEGANGRGAGKEILRLLKDRWSTLKREGPAYPVQAGYRLPTTRINSKQVTVKNGSGTVIGMCPVTSEKTVCCNLRTIDAVQGCGLACSYCSIQNFYDPPTVTTDADLAGKLEQVELDPSRNYHFGSGQSSDSLLLGNRNGILEAQLEFARRNPNVLLEFKTKSKNVGYLLKADLPWNVFVTWSLNTPLIIAHEEHRTASLEQRIGAARSLADRGIRVGFHLHPLVRYQGWREDYPRVIESVLARFSPSEVALVSFGTLTYIKSAIRSLRLKKISSKVLQMPLEDAAGKLSYPVTIKEELFRSAWRTFQPWHKKVFFYLCMEERELWESVWGFYYDNNQVFEDTLFQQVANKLKGEPL